jgi:hypothetical protein
LAKRTCTLEGHRSSLLRCRAPGGLTTAPEHLYASIIAEVERFEG